MCNVINYNLELNKQIELLGKALDRACAELEDCDTLYGDLKQVSEWREWCMGNEKNFTESF